MLLHLTVYCQYWPGVESQGWMHWNNTENINIKSYLTYSFRGRNFPSDMTSYSCKWRNATWVFSSKPKRQEIVRGVNVMRCPKGLWPPGWKNKHCWTRHANHKQALRIQYYSKSHQQYFQLNTGITGKFLAKSWHWELTADDDQDHDSTVLQPNSLYRAARLQTSNGFFCSVNHLSGGEVSVNHNATHSPSLAP